MNLFESIKNKHLENIQRRPRFIKESAEGGKEFWDKVDAGEIKVGGTLDSNGAGDIDVLDLNKDADYILIKRNSDYQPFVAAWAPEFYNGKLTWGQGHYFDNEDDAREYFNQKALGECDKKESEELNEMAMSDRLKGAREQKAGSETEVSDEIIGYFANTFNNKKYIDRLEEILTHEINNGKRAIEIYSRFSSKAGYGCSDTYFSAGYASWENPEEPDGAWGIYKGVNLRDIAKPVVSKITQLFVDLLKREGIRVLNTTEDANRWGEPEYCVKVDLENFDTAQEEVNESCGKKKRPTLKESNPARYLGIKQELNEAINHANDDINAKIKEALRSKTAARKYRKDLEDAGIKIDDSPREGVNLIGPNGRMLSADRQNIYGPTKPGHGRTHDDGRYGNSIKSKHKDLDSYDSYIAKDKENLDKLEKMQRDDVIRAYPNKTSEEAIEEHKKEIERGMNSLARDKRWKKDIEKDIHELRQARDKAHKGTIFPGYDDTTIDREKYYKDPKNKDGRGYSKLVDAIDYKGYLDSKDNNENKDFANGRYKQTPGQKLRNEFKSLKQTADGTYWGSYDAKRDLADKEIDAQAIENRKKELEEEYKKKMDDEVNSMLKRKSDADASYKSHKDSYRTRINALKDFRAKHGMEAKEDPDFETYITKKAGSRY